MKRKKIINGSFDALTLVKNSIKIGERKHSTKVLVSFDKSIHCYCPIVRIAHIFNSEIFVTLFESKAI